VALDIFKKYIRVEGGAFKSISVPCSVIYTYNTFPWSGNQKYGAYILYLHKKAFICGKLEIIYYKRMG
jgi:hypothetical protein